jgi:streptomycin 6-kinase
VIAGLLRRLWRLPSAPHPFRHLSAMTEYWSNETLADVERWPDTGLVREGLRLFEELPRTAPTEVLLATDLHAGNVLRSEREPWLVIDPKPFVGDPAYDATSTCSTAMRDCARTGRDDRSSCSEGWLKTIQSRMIMTGSLADILLHICTNAKKKPNIMSLL